MISRFIEENKLTMLIDVIKVISVLSIVYFQKFSSLLLIVMITNDSIFNAADVVIDSIIQVNGVKYENVWLQRFIYYCTMWLTAQIVELLTWWYFSKLLYWVVILTTIPVILNRIISSILFTQIYSIIIKPLENATQYTLCTCVSTALNKLCMVSLDIDPQISRGEISLMLKDSSDVYTLKIFAKSLVIAGIMSYLDKTGKTYGWIFGIIYNLGFADHKNDPIIDNIENEKRKILTIILNRKWELFYNPANLKTIIYLCEHNPNKSLGDMIKDQMINIERPVIKFFAVYSVTSLFSSSYVIVIMTWSLFIFSGNINIMAIVSRLLPTTYIIICDSSSSTEILLLSIVAELAEYIDNNVTRWLVRHIYNWININIWKLHQYNQYNTYLLQYISFVLIICSFIENIYAVTIVLLSAITIVYKSKLLLYFVLFGLFSGYSFIHMIVLGLLYYILINLINLPRVGSKPLNYNIIKNYEHQTTIRPAAVIRSEIIEEYISVPDILDEFIDL